MCEIVFRAESALTETLKTLLYVSEILPFLNFFNSRGGAYSIIL